MSRTRTSAKRFGPAPGVVALAIATSLTFGPALRAAEDAPTTPRPVASFDVVSMAGQWFEVAAMGAAWPHRRCVSGTRFGITVSGSRRADVVRTCTTASGIEVRRGRVTASADGSGALRGRFVGAAFAWIPAAWADYWVIAVGEGQRWLLIGDRRRDRLAVWSSVVALDESALAAAMAAGRANGFDPRQLRRVLHPLGPAAPMPDVPP